MFFKQCSLHKIFNNDKVTVELIYTSSKSCLKCGTDEFKIASKHPFSKTFIRHVESGKIIGRFSLTNWHPFKIYPKKLIFQEKLYFFNRLYPSDFALLNSPADHIFELKNNDQSILYFFNIGSRKSGVGVSTANTRFEGKIETTVDDLVLIGSGLFLVENDLNDNGI